MFRASFYSNTNSLLTGVFDNPAASKQTQERGEGGAHMSFRQHNMAHWKKQRQWWRQTAQGHIHDSNTMFITSFKRLFSEKKKYKMDTDRSNSLGETTLARDVWPSGQNEDTFHPGCFHPSIQSRGNLSLELSHILLGNHLGSFCTLVLDWLSPNAGRKPADRLWVAELAIYQFNTSFCWAGHPNDDWLPTGAFDIERADQWQWLWADWQQRLLWISVSGEVISCDVGSLSWGTFGILQKHSNLPEAEKPSTTLPPNSCAILTSCCCCGRNSLVAKSTSSSLFTVPLTWEIASNAQTWTNTTQLTHQCAYIPQRDWLRD